MAGNHMRFLPWKPLERYLVVNFPDPDPYRHGLFNAGSPDYVLSASWVAELLGVDRRTIYRHHKNQRILERTADQYAVELGLHPSWLWPEWFHDSRFVRQQDELPCA